MYKENDSAIRISSSNERSKSHLGTILAPSPAKSITTSKTESKTTSLSTTSTTTSSTSSTTTTSTSRKTTEKPQKISTKSNILSPDQDGIHAPVTTNSNNNSDIILDENPGVIEIRSTISTSFIASTTSTFLSSDLISTNEMTIMNATGVSFTGSMVEPTQRLTTKETTTKTTISPTTGTMKDWYLTPLVRRKGKEAWTGAWPSTKELPKNQRRDTACPFTYKNETRHRIKKWPDIIGIGAPKCGTGKLYSLIPKTNDPSLELICELNDL